MALEFKDMEEFNKANIAIKTANPRLCLMPLRYFGKCWKCPAFKTKKKGKICDSAIIVKSEMQAFEDAVKEKNRIIERLKEIEEQIKKVGK